MVNKKPIFNVILIFYLDFFQSSSLHFIDSFWFYILLSVCILCALLLSVFIGFYCAKKSFQKSNKTNAVELEINSKNTEKVWNQSPIFFLQILQTKKAKKAIVNIPIFCKFPIWKTNMTLAMYQTNFNQTEIIIEIWKCNKNLRVKKKF